ncbi:hypothetical protein [Micromonospora sp. CB01531]|uniref:hypothetical protein n=1 Tax=Micromonospora sp. CB01531 TaxID=1718947 RepID=UPI00093ADA03|nr:hypothetical protein [Micromonospora sp. CB01531]OKI42374.1 hypothetical protein A6A27_13830 [Micromonospora sp. CB01531]
MLCEEVAGKAEKSYQYAPWGQQLTQIKHKDDGGREHSQFIYRPRSRTTPSSFGNILKDGSRERG